MSADSQSQSRALAASLAEGLRYARDHLEFSPIFISDMAVAIAYTAATAYLYFVSGGEEPGCVTSLLLTMLVGGAQYAKIRQVMTLKREGGDARAYEQPDSLVISGAYRFSRNPTYLITAVQNLFWSALLIHEVDILRTAPELLAAAVVIPVVHFIAIDRWVIPREEANLRLSHPQEYAAYCARVNRWFGVRG